MKKSATQFILSILVILVITVAGCKDDDLDYQYPTATISHLSFDFSAGNTDTVNWINNDGETIIWQPCYGDNPLYPNSTTYIWWRNSQIDTVGNQNQTKDMGIVDLETVTQIPSTWDAAPDILPLLVGHTIVAKCRDGYVKFKILTADASGEWPAEVEYYFTTGTTFDH